MKFKLVEKFDQTREFLLEEAIRPDLKRFIEQHAELLDENNIEELYKQCPRELKIPLVRMLNAASLGDDINIIKRATYFADHYDDEELIDLALSFTHHVNDVFDAFDYLMNNWDECFDDDMLNEKLLTEKQWFKVTHKDPKHRVKDFYVYSVDISDAEKTLDHIYKITGGNHAKQSFDNSVKNDLLVTYPDRTDVDVSSYTGYPSANLISRIDRSFRHEATATVKTTKIPFSNNKFYIHHEDGKEHNQSLDNLMIWSNNDPSLAHIAHLVAHDSRNYSVTPYNKSINIYDYDTTTGNWIVVAQLNVTY